jgi:iron complex outermembrane receptor protein
MADALRYVPGVLAEGKSTGDDLTLSIRGSNLDAIDYDNSGVKLLADGLPVTTADGNNHNRLLDPLMARYVVVARGANALTYGASTLGGAIDFIPRTALNSKPGQAFIKSGSNGLRSGRVTAGGVSGSIDGMITFGRKNWRGYREHSRQHRTSVYANAGWQVSEDFNWRFFATHIANDQQLPGALTRARFNSDPRQANREDRFGNHQLNVDTDRLAARGEWRISAESRLTFGLSYEYESLYHPIVDVLVDAGGRGSGPPLDVFSLLVDTDQRTAGATLRYSLKKGDHDLLAGVNLAYTSDRGANYNNLHGRRNGQTDIVNKHARDAQLFLVDRWNFESGWTLIYGAQGQTTSRHDQNVALADHNARDRTDRCTAFSPRIGAIHALGTHSEAFASVSRLYEPPTNYDLDNARGERGNRATLDAMHGLSYEAGLRGNTTSAERGARWHWNASVYYANIRNEILSVENPRSPGKYISGNVQHTIHAGLEAMIGASFALGPGRIEPLVSATWNHFRFDDDPAYGNNVLPVVPSYTVHGEVLYQARAGYYIGPTLDLAGSRRADYRNTYRVDGYALAGLRAGFKRGRWDMFVEVRNLTNKNYVSAVTGRAEAGAEDAVLQPGTPRSLYLGLRVNF